MHTLYMMGCHNGLGVKLKQLNPNLFILGCACSKLMSAIEQFTRDVYTYVSSSSKRLSELKEWQIFAEEKPLKVLYPSQIRWLSVKVCLTIIKLLNY